MRNLIKFALTGAMAIVLASFTTDLSAQTARRSTAASSSSTSIATAKRTTPTTPASTSSSQVDRTKKTGSTSTATTSRRGSTTNVQTNTSRTVTPASTSSSQVDRTKKTGSTGTATTSRRGSTTNAQTNTSRTVTPASTSSSQVDRTKKTTTEGSSTTRRASSIVRSTNTTPATKEEPQSAKEQSVTRSNVNVTNRGLVTASAQQATDHPMNNYGQPGRYMRMDDGRNMLRIPPRERNFLTAPPAHFYSPDPHFFGYRVHSLPPRCSRTRLWGVDYYFYDNVYYRRYGNCYIICRPPFGVSVNITIRDRVFPSVRFSYYYSSYHILNVVDKNYKTIFKQNQQIAANNALLARQNAALALNTQKALSAYELANALGLVQSYAGIDTDYFYEDGVFYIINKKGNYEVIVPPAGALVDVLPEDYQTIVFNGVEYYLLDDTVYRLALYDGYPYLEVLGQMPVGMSNKYNLYY